MNILQQTKPRGGTKLARVLAQVEGDLWDGIVPVRDTHQALSGVQPLDQKRDQLCRTVAVEMRECLEHETEPYKIVQALREWYPKMIRANLIDKSIDAVVLEEAPVLLVQAQDALLVGISRCEGELSNG